MTLPPHTGYRHPSGHSHHLAHDHWTASLSAHAAMLALVRAATPGERRDYARDPRPSDTSPRSAW